MKIKLFLSMALVLFSFCAKGGDEAAAGGGGDTPVTTLWARTVSGGTNITKFNGVTLDSAGNVYACGSQSSLGGTYNYGSGITATGGNTLIVKYDSSGNAVWARTPTSGGTAEFSGCVTDSSGNVYAVGFIQGPSTMTFDTGVTAVGSYTTGNNALIVKYNSSGTAQWARTTAAGTTVSQFNGVAVDSSGDIYAVGFQSGTGAFTYGTTSINGTASGQNATIVKYDNSGAVQWAKTTTAGTSGSIFQAIAIDSSSNIYAAGSQSGTGTYTYNTGISATGTATTTSPILIKYNTAGAAQWASTITAGSSAGVFNGVGVDGTGSIYTVGSQSGTSAYTYAAGVTISGIATGTNSAIVKYNLAGTAQWARTVTGPSYTTRFNAVAVDAANNIYVAGIQPFETFTYGTGVTADSGFAANNTIVIKYSDAGAAQWARTTTNSSPTSTAKAVAVNSTGVYMVGYKFGNTALAFGNSISVTGAHSGGDNILIVKYVK